MTQPRACRGKMEEPGGTQSGPHQFFHQIADQKQKDRPLAARALRPGPQNIVLGHVLTNRRSARTACWQLACGVSSIVTYLTSPIAALVLGQGPPVSARYSQTPHGSAAITRACQL